MMSDISASSDPSSSRQNDIDDALERAFDALDTYDRVREDLAICLQRGYFALARAKQNLGPSRVGPASFRLHRLEPLLSIDCSNAGNSAFDMQLVNHKPVERNVKETPDDMNSFMFSALHGSFPSMDGTSARRRTENKSGEISTLTDAKSTQRSGDVDVYRLNPLHQFSAMPPPALREAQAIFRTAVELSVRVVQSRQAHDRACSKYNQIRGQ